MKKAKDLVKFAKTKLGLPYWYGTFGNKATKALLESKRKQYPSYYTANDFESQIGKKVTDCVGLVKWFEWGENPTYNQKQDWSAKGMYANSTEKGVISKMPKLEGILVYKGDTTKTIHHVGIYSTDGYVYEAKGHKYGVVKTKFLASEWKYWSKCPWFEYDDDVLDTEDDKITIDKANYFAYNISGTYETISDLNMRSGAGTNKKIVKILKCKDTVKCYGYYSKVGNTKWYLVKNGNDTGFVSSKYIKEV